MSDAIQYREGSRADRDAILALRRLVFPGVDEEKQDPRYWDWEFAGGPHGEARVFVAEGAEGVLAHIGFVRQRYDTRLGTAEGALAVDAMVHPFYRRRGVFSSLTRFASDRLRSDIHVATAYQVRPEVLGGMQAGGWQIAESLPVLVKPLSVRRIAVDLGMPLPGGTTRARANPSVRALEDDDLARLNAMTFALHPRQPRTAAFASWRYRKNPRQPYELDGWFEKDVLQAFVVHRSSTLKGMSTRAVVDAGAATGGDESLQSLLRHVCARNAGREGLAAALASRSHPSHGALRRSGFFPGPHRFHLLLQVFDRRFDFVLAEPWSLSWGDTDHL